MNEMNIVSKTEIYIYIDTCKGNNNNETKLKMTTQKCILIACLRLLEIHA